ncbi:MAG: exo-alpha-sialidase [Bacteroidales bacterium]|nr:exo-alpha-sialidase [Bacteroidales bacterium]
MRKGLDLLSLIVLGLTLVSCGSKVKVSQEFLYETASFPQCHASTIVEYPKGVLNVAFFGGDYESADNVCIYMCTKKIGDTKWSAPRKVAEDSLHACWNPVLFSPDESRLMLFYKTGPHVPEWVGHVKTSYDGGQTWPEEYIFPQGMLGAIKDKPVMLPSGRIICPSSEEIRVPGQKEVAWTVHFEISDDGARTWKKVGPVEKDDTVRVIQPTILIHEDGTLEALCRSSNGKLAVTYSHDNGDNWSKLELTDFPNNNSGIDVLTLPDGRFVMVANPVGTDWGERYPLCVYISKDGLNWKEIANLASDPVEEGYCYPCIIYGSDGALHIAYTWDRVKIRYARIEL